MKEVFSFLATLIGYSIACAATSPGTTPATPGTPGTMTPCKTCTTNGINTTPMGAGSKDFQSDVIDSTGACNTRTLTCVGLNANIEINNGDGVIPGDGMTSMMTVTCNAAGMWELMGVVITVAECAAG